MMRCIAIVALTCIICWCHAGTIDMGMIGSGPSCNNELLALKAQSFTAGACLDSVVNMFSGNYRRKRDAPAINADYFHFALCRSYDSNSKSMYTGGAAASNATANSVGLGCPTNGDLILFSIPVAPPKYTVSGVVKDATSSAVLSGVSVVLGSFSAITNSNGEYAMSGVPSGNYTMTFSKANYLPYHQDMEVNKDTTNSVFMSPSVSATSMRMVTTWGATSDLDTYLKVINSCLVYYGDPYCTCNGAKLQNDATYGYGPETMEIGNLAGCGPNTVSVYYVHVYSLDQHSIANAKVYNSQGLAADLSRSTTTFAGHVWRVFSVDSAGVITIIDDVVDSF